MTVATAPPALSCPFDPTCPVTRPDVRSMTTHLVSDHLVSAAQAPAMAREATPRGQIEPPGRTHRNGQAPRADAPPVPAPATEPPSTKEPPMPEHPPRKCITCGKPFIPKGAAAKYCGACPRVPKKSGKPRPKPAGARRTPPRPTVADTALSVVTDERVSAAARVQLVEHLRGERADLAAQLAVVDRLIAKAAS